jgi:hypothetical protein
VEFGHKVLLCQTAEKFITDYEVYEHQAADNQLTEPVIRRHEQLFGECPVVLAADKGFCPRRASSKRWPNWWRTWRSRGACKISWTKCLVPSSGVSGGDRGDYFRLETRFSLVSLFLSRI